MSNLLSTLRTSVAEIKENYGTGREMIMLALESCYALYCNIMLDASYYKPLRKLYRELGFKETKQTDAATKLIRLTIVQASKKANPYAQVFRIAYKAKVKPDAFLEWLEKHGGIERVRLSKNPVEDDAKPNASRSWGDIKEAAMDYIANLTPSAKVSFVDGKGITFKGNVAMLVVSRPLDTEDEHTKPLDIVEVLDADNSRLKSLLQYYSEQPTN